MNALASIDVLDGQVVRLRQRDFYLPKQYASAPEQVAALLQAAGITEVLLTDLNGLKNNVPSGLHWMKRFEKYGIKIIYRGGITHCNAAELAMELGASGVVVELPQGDESLAKFAPDWDSEHFILGLDAWGGIMRERDGALAQTLEKARAIGVKNVLISDVQRQGMMLGPDLLIYAGIAKQFPAMNLWAAGGIRDTGDAEKLLAMGMQGVVVGKALYEGKFPLRAFAGKSKSAASSRDVVTSDKAMAVSAQKTF